MLSTIPGIKSEFPFSYKFEDWNKMLDTTKGLLATPVIPPAPLIAGLPAAGRRSAGPVSLRHSERSQESLFVIDLC